MFEKEVVLVLGLASFLILAMIFVRQLYTIAIVGLLILIPFGNWNVMPRSVMGVPGLNIVNLVWIGAFLYTLAIILVNKQKWRIWEYFRGPMLLLLGVYFMLALRTILDLPALEGATAHHLAVGQFPLHFAGRLLEDFIKPLQIAMTGWMVLVYMHIKGGKENIHRGLMITAIALGVVVVSYYFAGLIELGHYSEAREFVTDNFGLHPNMIGRIVLGLFLAIMFAHMEVSPLLRLLGLFAALLIMTVAMSRAVYGVLLLVLFLHYREISKAERKILGVMFALIMVVFANDVLDRVKYGFVENSETAMGTSFKPEGGDGVDLDKLSAARLDSIWKYLFPEIEKRPFFGNGLHAIRKSEAARTGLILSLSPHSAVMEVLIDGGVVGLSLILAAYGWMRYQARQHRNELYYLILPALLLGISDPSYYPRLSTYVLFIFYALHQYDQGGDLASDGTVKR